MKRIVKLMLLVVLSASMLIGCGGKSKEKIVEKFINKLVSVDTYKEIAPIDEVQSFIEDCKLTFGDELSLDAFNELMANRVFAVYQEVIITNKVDKVTNLKLDKVKETKNDGYTHFEYEITYKLVAGDSKIDMKDYLAFNVLDDKGSVIDKVSISNKTSSVYKEYKRVVQ